MKKIISVINQKGGVGKTTTAMQLGSALKDAGYKVLFVDIDSQGNLSYILGYNEGPTIFDVLTKQANIEDAVFNGNGFSLLPASPNLSYVERYLPNIAKEYCLRNVLNPVQGNFDYIIIDAPPSLSLLTVNALTASTNVLIPSQADILSVQGIGQLFSTIRDVREHCNPALVVDGILITRYQNRQIHSREIRDMLNDTAKAMGSKVFETPIRETVAIRESQTVRESIFDYSNYGNAARDYRAFIKEYLGLEL